jgi:hypothetical protein
MGYPDPDNEEFRYALWQAYYWEAISLGHR